MEIRDLPHLNATLNALSAAFLVLGYVLIRKGKRQAHERAMMTALICAVAFLTSYLIYHYSHGSTRFPGTGTARTIYLTILASHTVLAATVPFLAVFTVLFARRGQFERHRRLARWTLPIWLYVSVTGVAVYWMLYQMTW